MENTKKKTNIKKTIMIFVIMTCLMLAGTFLCLVVHEGSHYITSIACNGTVTEFSLGSESHVGAYIQPQYISIIALSSVLIPLVLSLIFVWFKNFYSSAIVLGFSFANLFNAFFGFAAIFLVDDMATRETFDMAMAFNHSQNQTGMLFLIAGLVIVCTFCVAYGGHNFMQALEKKVEI